MKTCIVIGARGFIGSAIAAEAAARGYLLTALDVDNYAKHRGTKAGLLINAAGNSRKYLDDQDPLRGYDLSVTSVMNVLHDFHCDRFVQLSSGAVYPNEGDPHRNAEDAPLTPAGMSRYGFHKWLAEQLVLHYAPHHLILRLGGFVGPRLVKNAVCDLLAGRPLFVHPDSEFQYMDTRDLARAVFDLAERPELPASPLNVSARGTVSVRRIAEWAGISLPPDADHQPQVRAELNVDRAGQLLALPDTAETLRKFIREVQSGALTLP